jgi:hypothetical protein
MAQESYFLNVAQDNFSDPRSFSADESPCSILLICYDDRMKKPVNKTVRKVGKTTGTKRLTASEAAREALLIYRETFRDLARYDRGEKPLDTIPY